MFYRSGMYVVVHTNSALNTGSRHFVPGVTAGGIQKTNTYSPCCFLAISSMEIFIWRDENHSYKYVVIIRCDEDHSNKRALSQIDNVSILPPIESLLGFSETPLLFARCSSTSSKIEELHFLIAAPTVIVTKKTKQLEVICSYQILKG